MCSADSEGDLEVGWGPYRPLYYDDTFPTSLTFNSTVESDASGDERNWVVVKPAANTAPGGWVDELEVQPDETYLVRAYVRLDGPDQHFAEDTTLSFHLPTCTGHRVGVEGFLSASNVFPTEVWDGAEFWSRSDFNLALVPDSAVHRDRHRHPDRHRLYNNAGEFPLSSGSVVTKAGVQLGYAQMDGFFMPGYEHAAYVVFRVKAQVASEG